MVLLFSAMGLGIENKVSGILMIVALTLAIFIAIGATTWDRFIKFETKKEPI